MHQACSQDFRGGGVVVKGVADQELKYGAVYGTLNRGQNL